jgi:hypothetical protein
VAAPDVTALQRSDLNEFLFAGIGTEANGVTLSVVSVFARLGADPWREADRLAALSKADAADSLAHTIADMPKSLWTLPDAAAIAVRLIGLLPSRPVIGIKNIGIKQVTKRWPAAQTVLVLAGLVVMAAVAVITSMH